MKITKDALVRIIEAARITSCLADSFQAMLHGKATWTPADEANGKLIDALVLMAYGVKDSEGIVYNRDRLAEYFRDQINIEHRETLNPEALADAIIKDCDAIQPAPNTMERQSFEEMWKQAGGYLYKAVTGNDSR